MKKAVSTERIFLFVLCGSVVACIFFLSREGKKDGKDMIVSHTYIRCFIAETQQAR